MKLLFKEFFSFYSENFDKRELRMNNTGSLYSFLKKYENEENVFFSFRDYIHQPVGSENKIIRLNPSIGINPKSKYNTPNGIYGYPYYNMQTAVKKGKIPFASERPIVVVYKPKPGVKVTTPSNFLEPEYNIAIEKLGKMYNLTKEEIDNIFLIDIDKDYQNSYLQKIWSLTRFLSKKNPNKWAKLLVDLGLYIILDDWGSGFIHQGEPHQVVAFGKQYLQILDVSENQKVTSSPGALLELNFKNLSKHIRKKNKELLYNEYAVDFYTHKRRQFYNSFDLNELPMNTWKRIIDSFLEELNNFRYGVSQETIFDTASFLLLDIEKQKIIESSDNNKDDENNENYENYDLQLYNEFHTYLLAEYKPGNFLDEKFEKFLDKINKNKTLDLFKIFNHKQIINFLINSIHFKILDYSKLDFKFFERLFKDQKDVTHFIKRARALITYEKTIKEFKNFISILKDSFPKANFRDFQKNIIKSIILSADEGKPAYLKDQKTTYLKEVKDPESFLNKIGLELFNIKEYEKRNITSEILKDSLSSAIKYAYAIAQKNGPLSSLEYGKIQQEYSEKTLLIKSLVAIILHDFFEDFKTKNKLTKQNLKSINQNLYKLLSRPDISNDYYDVVNLFDSNYYYVATPFYDDPHLTKNIFKDILINIKELNTDGIDFLKFCMKVQRDYEFQVNIQNAVNEFSFEEIENLFKFIKNNPQLLKAFFISKKIAVALRKKLLRNLSDSVSPDEVKLADELRDYINNY